MSDRLATLRASSGWLLPNNESDYDNLAPANILIEFVDIKDE